SRPTQISQSLPRPSYKLPDPLLLQVHGAVMNINRGNPGEFEVVVDSWMWVCVCGGALGGRSLMGAVTGAGLGVLGGTGDRGEVGGALGSTVVGLGVRAQGQPPLTAAPPRRLDPSVRVGSLSPSHVDLLNETWPYGGNSRSRRYLAELLRCFPNLCLQDGAGQPLSWCLTDHFGTGAHGYTLPAHRRRGHMQAVMVLAARRAQARGFLSFGHTATGNRPMQRLQEELGHQRLPGLCRFVLHNPGLGRAGP
uniref:Glycine N-acyltransferase-like protein n=1 Tax=Otus sunia TaxID=257818 RepID=A0A8C8A735_9STRI